MIRSLLFFLPLLYFIVIPAKCQINSSDSLLDFRNVELKGHNTVKLDGEWFFHAGNLLLDEQLDTAYWELKKVPDNWINFDWKGKPISKKGVATYWTKIILTDIETPYAIKFYEALSAHKIYLNGFPLNGGGTVGLTEEEEIPGYGRDIYRIPREYLVGDTIDVVIHVSNFHYTYGAIRRSIIFGSESALNDQKTTAVAWQGFLLGAIVLIGLYHFVLFIFRPRDRSNLYFCLICLVVFFRTAGVDEMFIFNILPDLSWVNLMKIRWATTYISIPMAMLLIHSLYPHLFKKWIMQVFIVTGLFFMLLSFVIPTDASIYASPYYHIFMGIGGLYMNFVVLKAAIKKELGASILLIGLFVSYVLMVNDILLVWAIVNTGNMSAIGILIFISTLAIVNGQRFSKALNNEEKMSDELAVINRQLEEKVLERTKNVENQNKLIQEQHNSLKTVHDEQQNLLNIVVHDLKSPLNKIMGLSSLIPTMGSLNEDQVELNNKITQVSKAGQQLINDLNTLGYYENRKIDLSLKQHNLKDLVEEITVAYERLAKKKTISLQCKFEHKKESITTDKELFNRILDNVVSNAVKFSPSETTVFISTSSNEKSFEVSVRDQGPGFTQKDQEKIFRKFQKLSARPTGEESSTGLGLNIVKTLLDKLHGIVSLETSPKGSTFTLEFPFEY